MKKANYIHSEGGEVEVTFDDLQVELVDSVDHSHYYVCTGYDEDGNTYSGVAEFTCGEFEGIEDIEMTGFNPKTMASMKQLYDAEVRAGIYDPKNPTQTLQEKQIIAKKLK